MDDFESFETKGFVGRLLGKGDLTAMMEKLHTAMPEDKPEMMESIQKGTFTLRMLYE